MSGKPDVTLPELLQVLAIFEPLVEDVIGWLRGNDPEMPASLRPLPAEMKSEVELRLLRARAERRAG